ncbi:MAG TPA: MFS transporter [Verrucomicrobiota bacterium]|nr:MFS transporter [Verrucomicrobiota bacterium]
MLKGIAGAFSSRNYRLFFAGQAVSLAGAWMTQTASLWLVYHLSSSAAWLGVIGFATLAPIFIFAPFAGVLVDRVNRHRLLLVTQVAAMIQALTLAALALTGVITVSHLLVLSLVQGVINAVDMPVRQALVVDFIERKEHLGSAIALNSALFNMARLVGPALGGMVIAATSAGICYLLDGFSFLAVIGALLAMRLRPRPRRERNQHPWQDLREGFDYTRRHAPIRALILLVAAVSAVGFSSSVLMPIFARDVFHGDSRTLGWLLSASGAGALCAAIYLSTRTSVKGLGLVIRVGGVLLSAGLIGLGLARGLGVALVCMGLTGMGGVLVMASSNTLIQTLVEDDKRGRVMSLFAMAFTGTMPFGNLLMGTMAERLGVVITLAVAGVICGIVVVIFHLRIPRLRAAARPLLERLEQAAAEPPLFTAEEQREQLEGE